MKIRRIAALGLIGAFFLFSAFSFQESLTPYVSFSKAKEKPITVQVKGVLAPGSLTTEAGTVKFLMRDDAGEEFLVVYQGAKPEGMEQASGIVAVGKAENGSFTADKLLVKCPSKYQGTQNGGTK